MLRTLSSELDRLDRDTRTAPASEVRALVAIARAANVVLVAEADLELQDTPEAFERVMFAKDALACALGVLVLGASAEGEG